MIRKSSGKIRFNRTGLPGRSSTPPAEPSRRRFHRGRRGPQRGPPRELRAAREGDASPPDAMERRAATSARRTCGSSAAAPGDCRCSGVSAKASQIVEVDASVVRAAVEVHRAAANRAMCVGVDVARDRPVAIARPSEGWRRVVQCEVRNTAPPAAATAARVSSETAGAVVGMIGGIAHVVKPGGEGAYRPTERWRSRGRGASTHVNFAAALRRPRSRRPDVLDLTTAADKCDLDAGGRAAGCEPLRQFERAFGPRDDRDLTSARRISHQHANGFARSASRLY